MLTVTGLVCQACGESVQLDPDRLVVAAAETVTFADAHGEHETCGFTLLTGAPRRRLTSNSD
jgi:hypothetical protein